MGLRRSANGGRAMHDAIHATNQAPQAIKVFERTFDPMNIKP
jgi:hypothetical protein